MEPGEWTPDTSMPIDLINFDLLSLSSTRHLTLLLGEFVKQTTNSGPECSVRVSQQLQSFIILLKFGAKVEECEPSREVGGGFDKIWVRGVTSRG